MTSPATTRQRTATLRIWRGTCYRDGHFEEHQISFEDGESVLDGLIRLRRTRCPDLAFRFSCLNANVCKECTMLINGRVEYACVAKLSEATHLLEPLPGKQVLRDLVTDTLSRKERLATGTAGKPQSPR